MKEKYEINGKALTQREALELYREIRTELELEDFESLFDYLVEDGGFEDSYPERFEAIKEAKEEIISSAHFRYCEGDRMMNADDSIKRDLLFEALDDIIG